MLVVTKRRYKKSHVVGGAGIFDTVAGFFKRLVTSNAAKQLASSALSAGKQAAKEIGQKAIDVAKDKVVDVGKRLVEKAFRPTTQPITQETKVILSRLLGTQVPESMNINNLMMGHGLNSPIRIQDLVKRLNGAGLKVV
jgi:hypothetical protein